MGGFFMLLKLIILRLVPLLAIGFVKERRTMRGAARLLIGGTLFLVLTAVWEVFCLEGKRAFWCLPISLFPHYLFYLFAIWLIGKCIWKSWSERVWKRIYFLAVLSTIFGILTENYINPQILQFFFKNFK
jgi:hypothetical protein